jgi:hypothetical protein
MQKRRTGSDRVLLELKSVNATTNGAIASLVAFCTSQRTRISVNFTQCPLITRSLSLSPLACVEHPRSHGEPVAEIAGTSKLADVSVCAATKVIGLDHDGIGSVLGVARKLRVDAHTRVEKFVIARTGGLLPV